MVVHRRTLLPSGPSRGRILLPESTAIATAAALQSFGDDRGPHEGLLLWAGRWCDGDAVVHSAVVPRSIHDWGSVFVSERDQGLAAQRARALGLVIVAQVHSHPGIDTRHSDGDDTLILMPYQGMFSVVVGQYGRGGLLPAEGAGVHQYQDRRWVFVSNDSPGVISVSPSIVEVEP